MKNSINEIAIVSIGLIAIVALVVSAFAGCFKVSWALVGTCAAGLIGIVNQDKKSPDMIAIPEQPIVKTKE